MSLGELLRTKSSEYELLAEWHAERAPLDDEHFVACQAIAVVGIVLREVAEAIDVEWGEEADNAEEPVAVSGRVLTRPRVGSTRSHEKLVERFSKLPSVTGGPHSGTEPAWRRWRAWNEKHGLRWRARHDCLLNDWLELAAPAATPGSSSSSRNAAASSSSSSTSRAASPALPTSVSWR